MKNKQLQIIIDADIARASGVSQHPVSSNARKLLDGVMSNGHCAIMCPTLRSEWNKHKSLYSRRWLSSMIAKRKVTFVKHSGTIKDEIENKIPEGKRKNIMIKDVHLIDQALKGSKLIASNDNNARIEFCKISKIIPVIKSVIWVHSVSDKDFIEKYLIKTCLVPDDLYLCQ